VMAKESDIIQAGFTIHIIMRHEIGHCMAGRRAIRTHARLNVVLPPNERPERDS
jgi:hypothetical protein